MGKPRFFPKCGHGARDQTARPQFLNPWYMDVWGVGRRATRTFKSLRLLVKPFWNFQIGGTWKKVTISWPLLCCRLCLMVPFFMNKQHWKMWAKIGPKGFWQIMDNQKKIQRKYLETHPGKCFFSSHRYMFFFYIWWNIWGVWGREGVGGNYTSRLGCPSSNLITGYVRKPIELNLSMLGYF